MSYQNLPSILDQGTTITIRNNIDEVLPTNYSKFVQTPASNSFTSAEGTLISTLSQTPSGVTCDNISISNQLTSLNLLVTNLLKSKSITDNGTNVVVSTPLIAPNIDFTGDYKYSEQTSNHVGSSGTWLICNGSVYSPTTYPKLFQLIGIKFGGTSSSPLLPNLAGRVLAMSGNGHHEGSYYGEDNHTLIVSEMPIHNHTDSGHINITSCGDGFPAGRNTKGGENFLYVLGTQTTSTQLGRSNIQNNGGSGSHNNVQPTMYCQNIFIFSN